MSRGARPIGVAVAVPLAVAAALACSGDAPSDPGGQPPPGGLTFSFSGRSPTGDPPLPAGFQDQLFVTVRDRNGATVAASIVWSSLAPAIASMDQNGVVTALAAGTAVLRAGLAGDTAGATLSLPTRIAAAGGAVYAGNAEFGEPADADASDDVIVRRDQYVASFNPARGIPNWVSYNLEATHLGAEDRCDCFTFDPNLPAAINRYTTADYTGAGAAAGYGIDRGHLVPSADRTTGSQDNAVTYYFTNIIPQASDNNQGPWAGLEGIVRDTARTGSREVYVVAGASGSRGSVKGEGRITIPVNVWKAVVIMARDRGLADVQTAGDLTVIAVIMPNTAGIRSNNWETYRVTVDSIEALSGYDLLALLPDDVERIVESGGTARRARTRPASRQALNARRSTP